MKSVRNQIKQEQRDAWFELSELGASNALIAKAANRHTAVVYRNLLTGDALEAHTQRQKAQSIKDDLRGEGIEIAAKVDDMFENIDFYQNMLRLARKSNKGKLKISLVNSIRG